MELKKLGSIGIIFIFAISLSLPCETFACWTDAGYTVDCCFVNPSEKGDYCCATVEDCCAEGFESCEYNTWRDECDCGSSCDDFVPTSTCPSTSVPTTTPSSIPTTTTSCPPDKICGDECCDNGYYCCGDTTCCIWIAQICCEGICCDQNNEVCVNGACIPKFTTSEHIYGEHSEEAELLRKYRDEVLSKTPVGQEIIRLYYEWSPAIVKAMKENKEFKGEIKKVIDGVLELIEGKVE